MRYRHACALAGIMVAGTILPAAAKTYFASPSGTDTNPGTSDKPFRTLQKAKTFLKPGDTLLIGDGEYPGGVKQNISGKAGMPITYRAMNPGRAILRGDQTTEADVFTVRDASWIVVDGLVAQGGKRTGFYAANGNSVAIRNCTARNNGVTGILTGYCDDLLIENNDCYGNREQHGIYISNSGDRPVVRSNRSYGNGRCGIQLNGDGKQLKPALGSRGDGIIMAALVDGNVLYENGATGGGSAINLFSVRNSDVTNNLVYNNYAGGISLSNDNAKTAPQWGSKNNLIASNTIHFRRIEGRWCLSFLNGCTGNVVVNNILAGGARGAYQYDETSTFRADYNAIHSAKSAFAAVYTLTGKMITAAEYRAQTGNDTHSVYADPRFVGASAASPDFHLRADSPARRAGVSLVEVREDANGMVIRSGIAPDLGCFGGASMAEL